MITTKHGMNYWDGAAKMDLSKFDRVSLGFDKGSFCIDCAYLKDGKKFGGYFTLLPISSKTYRLRNPTQASWKRETSRTIVVKDDCGNGYTFVFNSCRDANALEVELKDNF